MEGWIAKYIIKTDIGLICAYVSQLNICLWVKVMGYLVGFVVNFTAIGV